ncbi:hypothetical protein C2G38_2244341 [Gigaspora rosea]|uniref:Uncharacterized protein n=1 Tax=Gigaspora rosea TaxID=44941 RepID=A0A397VFS2_9GLOM|nr:hypothetical protein C2G38_2244341 [Gigaspora rosea]
MKHFCLTFFHILAKNSDDDNVRGYNFEFWLELRLIRAKIRNNAPARYSAKIRYFVMEKHLKESESIAISDRIRRRTIKTITIQEEIGRTEEQISEKSKKHKASTKECVISSSSSRSKSFYVDSKSKRNKDNEKNNYEETKRRKMDDENYFHFEIPSPRAVTPLPPQTPEHQMFSSSSLTTRRQR